MHIPAPAMKAITERMGSLNQLLPNHLEIHEFGKFVENRLTTNSMVAGTETYALLVEIQLAAEDFFHDISFDAFTSRDFIGKQSHAMNILGEPYNEMFDRLFDGIEGEFAEKFNDLLTLTRTLSKVNNC